jgi:hypothetical protein
MSRPKVCRSCKRPLSKSEQDANRNREVNGKPICFSCWLNPVTPDKELKVRNV